MRFLAFITAFLFAVGVYAQPAAENVLSGTYNVLTATPVSGDTYDLSGFFNDLGGVYTPAQVAAGQIVWDQMGQRFVIDSKSSNTPLNVRVTALNPGDFPETGIGCVVVETNDFPPIVAGVSGVLQAKIDNHFKQILQPGGGVTVGGRWGEIYIISTDPDTVAITAGTPEIINEVTQGDTLGFKVEGGRLIYTDTAATSMRVVVSVGGSFSVANNNVDYWIYKNGSPVLKSETEKEFGTANSQESVPLTTIIPMVQFDTLDVRVDAESNGTLIVRHLNMNVATIGGAGGGGGGSSAVYREQYWTLETGSTLTVTAGTLPADPAKIEFYRNGLMQRPGVGQDYTVSGATITLAVSAQSQEVFRIVFIE